MILKALATSAALQSLYNVMTGCLKWTQPFLVDERHTPLEDAAIREEVVAESINKPDPSFSAKSLPQKREFSLSPGIAVPTTEKSSA